MRLAHANLSGSGIAPSGCFPHPSSSPRIIPAPFHRSLPLLRTHVYLLVRGGPRRLFENQSGCIQVAEWCEDAVNTNARVHFSGQVEDSPGPVLRFHFYT